LAVDEKSKLEKVQALLVKFCKTLCISHSIELNCLEAQLIQPKKQIHVIVLKIA